jgi:hypothetical protein
MRFFPILSYVCFLVWSTLLGCINLRASATRKAMLKEPVALAGTVSDRLSERNQAKELQVH